MLRNMTDTELLKVCGFDQPESKLTPTEHLLVEMGKRLESALDRLLKSESEYDKLTDKIENLQAKLPKVDN